MCKERYGVQRSKKKEYGDEVVGWAIYRWAGGKF
jgi:hypothetical protein